MSFLDICPEKQKCTFTQKLYRSIRSSPICKRQKVETTKMCSSRWLVEHTEISTCAGLHSSKKEWRTCMEGFSAFQGNYIVQERPISKSHKLWFYLHNILEIKWQTWRTNSWLLGLKMGLEVGTDQLCLDYGGACIHTKANRTLCTCTNECMWDSWKKTKLCELFQCQPFSWVHNLI